MAFPPHGKATTATTSTTAALDRIPSRSSAETANRTVWVRSTTSAVEPVATSTTSAVARSRMECMVDRVQTTSWGMTTATGFMGRLATTTTSTTASALTTTSTEGIESSTSSGPAMTKRWRLPTKSRTSRHQARVTAYLSGYLRPV